MAKKTTHRNINFYGSSDLLKKIEAAAGSIEKSVETALRKSSEKPKKEMLNYMGKHRRSGATEESFRETFERGKDGKFIYKLGFDIKKGGLPALFLNYGTPKIPPSFFIDNALENNIDEIIKIQNDTLQEILKELL